jgi:DNA-binding GntR family transcriptional regulator
MKAPRPRPDAPPREKNLLYRNVANELRRRIITGVYPPNARLPGLNELVDEFAVSVITVRRALRELAYEGLLFGHQGLGVFVKEKAVIHRVLAGDADRSIGDEIKRAGYQPLIKELKFARVATDEETARRLGVKPGTKVMRHEKLAFADAEPVSLHILHLPEPLGRRLGEALGKDFIFRVLKHKKVEFDRLAFEFAAAALGNDQADLFKLPAGFPMSVVYFTPIAKSGKPILTGITICRADRFVYEVEVPAVARKPARRMA